MDEPEPPEDDWCPATKNHQHDILTDPLVEMTTGFHAQREGGIVVDVHCSACGKSGSTTIELQNILW